MIYPYTTPQILTDANFVAYGGQTGTTTAFQRQAAYLIAETALSSDVETMPISTRMTGTFYPNVDMGNVFFTDCTYVWGVHILNMYDSAGTLLVSVSGTTSGWFNIRNAEMGQIDFFYPVYSGLPYKVEYIYDAGLPASVGSSPNILLALTLYANIILNELMGYGNESVGDIGVQDFSNQQYRESRVTLLRTSFGTSAKAQLISKLTEKYRLHRYAGRGL